jgi:hypothetical protein
MPLPGIELPQTSRYPTALPKEQSPSTSAAGRNTNNLQSEKRVC